MKKLIVFLALVALAGCGQRVDYPTITTAASCGVESQTEFDVTISCNDGTTLTVPKPVREVEVEVPVEVTPEPTPTPIPEECEDSKVTVCHKGKTIEIALAALPAHSGDMLGECVIIDPPCEGDDCGGGDDQCEGDDCDDGDDDTPVMVTLCHKPGTPAEKTMTVPSPAVAGHLGHGDYLGACGAE